MAAAENAKRGGAHGCTKSTLIREETEAVHGDLMRATVERRGSRSSRQDWRSAAAARSEGKHTDALERPAIAHAFGTLLRCHVRE